MPAARSAGVLLYRQRGDALEVLLVHPGGPFWRSKDVGAWQIPKGLIEDREDAATAARREAEEELGIALVGALQPLACVRQSGGKMVEAFALEQDLDVAAIRSNEFEIEWPPRSGKRARFPEVDRACWYGLKEAEAMMLTSQRPLLAALIKLLAR